MRPHPTFCFWLEALYVHLYNYSNEYELSTLALKNFYTHAAEPPRIISHPQELKDAGQGKSAKFTVQAAGTELLSYLWQWKPVEESGSEEWQPCPAEWSDGATLTIPSVQKSSEGSYRCIVSNCAGDLTSNPAFIVVGKCSI